MTASNKDDLHKSPQNLEREAAVNCRVLQASYMWEFLQDEQLSSLNDGVREPAIRLKNFTFLIYMQSAQQSGQPVFAYSCRAFINGGVFSQRFQQQVWLCHICALPDLQGHLPPLGVIFWHSPQS